MKFPFLIIIATSLFLNNQTILAQYQPAKPEKPAATEETSFPEAAPTANYTSRIIAAESGTFGYEILQNGRQMIHQVTIPGRPGNKGFATKADAGKVAELVIAKLKKGEMPPSVTPEEMEKLNISK